MYDFIVVIIVLSIIIGYLIGSCLLFNMFKKADLKKPWIAFIPILGNIKTLHLVNLSMWYFVLFAIISLIPVVGSITLFLGQTYLLYTIGKNFGLKPVYCIIGIFIPFIMYLVIVCQNKDFVIAINKKYVNN